MKITNALIFLAYILILFRHTITDRITLLHILVNCIELQGGGGGGGQNRGEGMHGGNIR